MKTFFYRSCIPLFLFIMIFSVNASAAPAAMQDEIAHLLNYIETSDCIFIRNNSRHAPAKAVKHIKKKFNHLKKRIKTTEDFIKGAATGSSISGKPYMIICNDNEMATADWLLAELELYRSRQP